MADKFPVASERNSAQSDFSKRGNFLAYVMRHSRGDWFPPQLDQGHSIDIVKAGLSLSPCFGSAFLCVSFMSGRFYSHEVPGSSRLRMY